uniref:Uncharacterized protein n=1 Tax=Globisporangium ultimum (strain ATCC 200006 / CBS 805.95 / DAOM BR144) TaxID=431595 RepID=K3X8Z7_GLOUD
MSYHSPLTSATIDRAFLSVIHNYNRVRHLDLSGQRSLNDRDLLVLASCFWSHLEHISVNDCLDITDFGLLSVLNAQSLKLTSVSMRHCKQITGNFSTQQITGRHPALAKLDFYDTRVSFNLVNNLGTVFPSLQEIHAVHTPAHLEFFQHIKWQDLVDDLLFLVMNEMVDLPHLQGLLAEFASRTRELRNGDSSADSSADSSIRVGRKGKHKDTLGVFQRTLLGEGHHALLDVPLLRGEWNSALLFACENGLIKVIPELLVACGGCACDVTDKDGASPLCVAVTNGLTDAVKILLQSGADVNKRTYSLATPLYIASEMNWDNIIDVLLRSGAQTDCAVLGGATALCVAAKNGNRSTVLRLLAAEQMRHQVALALASRPV